MSEYKFETMYQIWDESGDCVEVGPDRDDLELTEIRSRVGNEIEGGMVFNDDQLPLLIQALQKIASEKRLAQLEPIPSQVVYLNRYGEGGGRWGDIHTTEADAMRSAKGAQETAVPFIRAKLVKNAEGSETNNLEELQDDNNRLDRELTRYKSKVAVLEQEREAMKEKLSASLDPEAVSLQLEKDVAHRDTLGEEIDALKQEVLDLKSANNTLENQLTDAQFQMRNAVAKSAYEASQAEYRSVADQLSKAQDEVARLSNNQMVLRKENKELTEKLSKSPINEIYVLKDENRKMKAELSPALLEMIGIRNPRNIFNDPTMLNDENFLPSGAAGIVRRVPPIGSIGTTIEPVMLGLSATPTRDFIGQADSDRLKANGTYRGAVPQPEFYQDLLNAESNLVSGLDAVEDNPSIVRLVQFTGQGLAQLREALKKIRSKP